MGRLEQAAEHVAHEYLGRLGSTIEELCIVAHEWGIDPDDVTPEIMRAIAKTLGPKPRHTIDRSVLSGEWDSVRSLAYQKAWDILEKGKR